MTKFYGATENAGLELNGQKNARMEIEGPMQTTQNI